MARLNKSIIGELQSQTLKQKIDTSLNGVDIDYKGRSRVSPDTLVKNGYSAHINRALFWLSSKRDDYIRESFKGGVLYDLLGVLGNDTNLKDWEEIIRNKFNEEFSNDLELMVINLSMNKQRKMLSITMIIRDVIKNRTFPVSMEAKI